MGIHIVPDSARLNDGYLEIETWHFSAYCSKEMADAEQAKLYAQKMAVRQWNKEGNEPNTLIFSLTDNLKHYYNKGGILIN